MKGKSKTILKAGLAFFVLIICFFTSSGRAGALNGADIALYNDAIAPYYKGVWQDGLTAIRNMLSTLGFTYEEVTYKDLNSSTQDFSRLYKVMLFPGGYAPYYNYWISKNGKDRIRNFVNTGGGYYGICAGAYFAVDRVEWGNRVYDDAAGYDLDLFPGTGTGDEEKIADYYAGNWSMLTFDFENENTILSDYKAAPYTEDIIYLGGPYFTADAGAVVEVLATYNYNGKPGIVAFQHDSGKVVLSGPHPEIEEDSSRDGVTIQGEDTLNDNGSDWELARHLLNWLQALNLPSKQESFSFQPVENPVRSNNPAEAKPVGIGTVATGGSTLSMEVGLDMASGNADLYFGIYSTALDTDNIYILKSDNTFQTLSTGLEPWRPDTAGPISENLFGDIAASSLPKGTYDLYFLVTPAGNLDSYYLWSTYFIIP